MPSKLGLYSKNTIVLQSAPETSVISRNLSVCLIWLLISLSAQTENMTRYNRAEKQETGKERFARILQTTLINSREL